MSDPTRTTGATGDMAQQIEAAANRRFGDATHEYREIWTHDARHFARYLVPPDQCIVPRSFIAAVDAAISEAEELDYTTPAIRIPIYVWQNVENARDTFKEGPRSSEPPSTAHATTVAQLERQCSLTFAAITDAIDGLIARIAALEAELEATS